MKKFAVRLLKPSLSDVPVYRTNRKYPSRPLVLPILTIHHRLDSNPHTGPMEPGRMAWAK